MKNGTALIIASLFCCVVWLSSERVNLSAELDFKNSSCRQIKRSWNWKSQLLKTYLQIVLIQDSLINSNPKTKKAKRKNKNLEILTQSLNNGKWKQEKN